MTHIPSMPSAYLQPAPSPRSGSLLLHLLQGTPLLASLPALVRSPSHSHRPPSPAQRGCSSLSTRSDEQAGGKEYAIRSQCLWRGVQLQRKRPHSWEALRGTRPGLRVRSPISALAASSDLSTDSPAGLRRQTRIRQGPGLMELTD